MAHLYRGLPAHVWTVLGTALDLKYNLNALPGTQCQYANRSQIRVYNTRRPLSCVALYTYIVVCGTAVLTALLQEPYC